MQSRYFWPHHTVNITAIFQCIMLLIQWTLSMLNTGRYPSCRLGAFYVESNVLWSKLKSLDEILWCGHSKETSSAVLSHGTIFLVCSSNFWVCEWNLAVWSLQTKPLHPCFPIVLLFFLTKTCDVTIKKKTSSAENSHRHVQWNPALRTPAYNRHSYIMDSFPTLKNLKFSLKITR